MALECPLRSLVTSKFQRQVTERSSHTTRLSNESSSTITVITDNSKSNGNALFICRSASRHSEFSIPKAANVVKSTL